MLRSNSRPKSLGGGIHVVSPVQSHNRNNSVERKVCGVLCKKTDAILTCDLKPTRVRLMYSTEQQLTVENRKTKK